MLKSLRSNAERHPFRYLAIIYATGIFAEIAIAVGGVRLG